MIKKIIALVITITLILSAFAGCGGSGGGGSSNANTATAVFPALAQEYAVSRNITAVALQQYIYARLLLEQLTQSTTPEEFEGLIDETLEAFLYADEFAAKAVKYAEWAALKNGDSLDTANAVIKTKFGNPFVLSAYAAGDPTFDPKAWAADITKKFDAGKVGEQVRNLAAQLGVDAKEAYEQLKAAQAIIKQGADADAAFYDTAMKAAMATKTACKVGLVVTGAIATGGVVAAGQLSTAGIFVESAVLAVNAVDAIVDVGVTGSTIYYGEDHAVTKVYQKMADDLAPIVAVANVTSILTCDFSKIEQLQKTAVGAIDFIGQSIVDLAYSDTVIGVDVSTKPDGKTEVNATAVDIPQTSDGKVDAPQLNKNLADAGLPPIPETAPDPVPIDNKVEEFKQTKPNPADVSKQIDEALKELEALLVELGKLDAMPDIVGKYVGTYAMTETIDSELTERQEGVISIAVDISGQTLTMSIDDWTGNAVPFEITEASGGSAKIEVHMTPYPDNPQLTYNIVFTITKDGTLSGTFYTRNTNYGIGKSGVITYGHDYFEEYIITATKQ